MYIQLTDGKNNFLLQIMCFFWRGKFSTLKRVLLQAKRTRHPKEARLRNLPSISLSLK